MFEYVPTSAAAGVPDSRPVVVLNVAHAGLVLDAERERVAVGIGRRGHEAVRARRVHRAPAQYRRSSARDCVGAGRTERERGRWLCSSGSRRRLFVAAAAAAQRSRAQCDQATIQDRTCA